MSSTQKSKIATININGIFSSQFPAISPKTRKPVDPVSNFFVKKEHKSKRIQQIQNTM